MSEFNGTIVDVRTRAEFSGGHVAQSVNIPLQEIMEHVEAIKHMKTPVIFCCAAGIRSEQATQYFKSLGVDCENGGSWSSLQGKI
jgi:rhodanese-related sulfurtransferase